MGGAGDCLSTLQQAQDVLLVYFSGLGQGKGFHLSQHLQGIKIDGFFGQIHIGDARGGGQQIGAGGGQVVDGWSRSRPELR